MHWAHAWQKRVCARFTLLLAQREGIAASRRAATLNRVLRIVPALGYSITAAALLLGCGHSSISPSKPAPPAGRGNSHRASEAAPRVAALARTATQVREQDRDGAGGLERGAVLAAQRWTVAAPHRTARSRTERCRLLHLERDTRPGHAAPVVVHDRPNARQARLLGRVELRPVVVVPAVRGVVQQP